MERDREAEIETGGIENRGFARSPGPVMRSYLYLQAGDVHSFGTTITLGDFELYLLALVQGLEP